tara:strand:- start:5271 stop:5858 length:588 start_codon:yes stop_codon:yes gene_type:complete
MGADPLTMMLIAGAAGSVLDGVAAGKAGKANQSIHRRNADILRMRAKEFESAAEKNADLLRDRNKKKLSSDSVKYMKSGVELAGSPLEVLGDSALEMEFEAQLMTHEGVLKAYETNVQASMQEYEGQMAAWRGKQQKNAAFMKAGISALGAAYSGGMFSGTAATTAGTTAGAGAGAGGVSFGSYGTQLPYGQIGI